MATDISEQMTLNRWNTIIGRRQTSWLFHKCSREVESELYQDQFQRVATTGLEAAMSGFQGKRPNLTPWAIPSPPPSTYDLLCHVGGLLKQAGQ